MRKQQSRDTAIRTPVTLILSLGKGGEREWRTFYALYGPFVYQVALWTRLQPQDAEDVTSRVMSRLFQRFRGGFRYDPVKGRFRHYVATLTRREAKACIRKARRDHRGIDELAALADIGPLPEQRLADLELSTRLEMCIDRLRKTRTYQVRTLRVFDRYVLRAEDAGTVAKRYKIKVQRVYDIKNQVIQELKKIMAQLESELGEI